MSSFLVYLIPGEAHWISEYRPENNFVAHRGRQAAFISEKFLGVRGQQTTQWVLVLELVTIIWKEQGIKVDRKYSVTIAICNINRLTIFNISFPVKSHRCDQNPQQDICRCYCGNY